MLKEAAIHFSLFDKPHFSNICTLWCATIQTNWLCKDRKKVRGTQASILINSSTELSKIQLFLWLSLSYFVIQVSPLLRMTHLILKYTKAQSSLVLNYPLLPGKTGKCFRCSVIWGSEPNWLVFTSFNIKV